MTARLLKRTLALIIGFVDAMQILKIFFKRNFGFVLLSRNPTKDRQPMHSKQDAEVSVRYLVVVRHPVQGFDQVCRSL